MEFRVQSTSRSASPAPLTTPLQVSVFGVEGLEFRVEFARFKVARWQGGRVAGWQVKW